MQSFKLVPYGEQALYPAPSFPSYNFTLSFVALMLYTCPCSVGHFIFVFAGQFSLQKLVASFCM